MLHAGVVHLQHGTPKQYLVCKPRILKTGRCWPVWHVLAHCNGSSQFSKACMLGFWGAAGFECGLS